MRAVQVVRLDGPAAVEVREVAGADARAAAGARRRRTRPGSTSRTSCRPGPLPVQARAAVHAGLRGRGHGAGGAGRLAARAGRPGGRVHRSRAAFAEAVAVTPTHGLPAARQRLLRGRRGPADELPHRALRPARCGATCEAGETVLVHGAAGGVGTACDAVGRGARAPRVIAVVSRDAKAEVARAAGAHARRARRRLPRRRQGAHRGGVDLVVDPVGGDRFTDSLRCLAPARAAAGRRLHRGRDPHGQGQPAAAQQHRRRRRRLGRLRARQARLRRGAVGRAAAAPRARARSTRRSGPASRSRRRRRRWPRSTSGGCSARSC